MWQLFKLEFIQLPSEFHKQTFKRLLPCGFISKVRLCKARPKIQILSMENIERTLNYTTLEQHIISTRFFGLIKIGNILNHSVYNPVLVPWIIYVVKVVLNNGLVFSIGFSLKKPKGLCFRKNAFRRLEQGFSYFTVK